MLMTRGEGARLMFLFALLVSACGQKSEGGGEEVAAKQQTVEQAPSQTAPAAADPHAEAEEIFKTRCTTCHGPEGKGDGPASVTLNPKPRNFSDQEWQKQVTDEHIEKIIQYGGAAVGKSAAMPGNPDLMSKPAVVAALREHVRSLATP